MTILDRFTAPKLRVTAWTTALFVPAMAVLSVPLALMQGASHRESWSSIAGNFAFLVVVASFPLVGLLILRREPRNTEGWILQLVGLLWGLSMLGDNYATYGLLVNPGALPGADFVAAVNVGMWAPAIGVMGTFLLLLYPDGHLPTRRWRPVAWLSGVTIVVLTTVIAISPGRLDEGPARGVENPIGIEGAKPVLDVLIVVLLPLLPCCILLSALSLVLRFRHSGGIERLQLKWLASAAAVVALLYGLALGASLFAPAHPFAGSTVWWLSVLQTVAVGSFVLFPVAIGIAILRHGLYGIDLVINRTLVYGSLTVTSAAVYIGSVLLFQLVLAPFTPSSDLAVAASTLAVAALFGPARRRIQAIVDRRFYRSRYDAARTLDAFVSRLRHEVDLDALGTDLRATVEQTVQPTHLSLWIRP